MTSTDTVNDLLRETPAAAPVLNQSPRLRYRQGMIVRQ